jgi:hypothetical protein
MLLPRTTVEGPDLMIDTSAVLPVGHVRDVVTVLLVLLELTESVVSVVTVAVLLMLATEQFAMVGMLKTKETVAVAPEAMVPKEQSTVAPFCAHDALLVYVCNVRPAGTVSCVTTLSAAAGPAFATVSTYVIVEPRIALTGPVLVIDISAVLPVGHVSDVVTAELTLLELAGSVVLLVTVAMLLMLDVTQFAIVGMLKTIETVDDAPDASWPNTQSTVDAVCVQFALPVCVTRVKPAGTVSCVTTLAAASGPAFVTVSA